MPSGNKSTLPGKLFFAFIAIAMLAFFWWLLLYDHGVMPMH